MLLLTCAAALFLGARGPLAQEPRLVRAIGLGDLEGRLDHLALDAHRGRLFVTALAKGSVEVVDLARGIVVQSLPGLSRPQGALYVSGQDRLLVTCGGDGKLVLYDGATQARLTDLDVGLDADGLSFDERCGIVLVGAGQGQLVFVDLAAWSVVGRAEVEGHPEGFALDPAGKRAYVNVPSQGQIALVDLAARVRTDIWTIEGASANFPLAVAPDDGAVLVGCRTPGNLVVVDPATGKGVIAGDLSAQADQLFVLDGGRRALITTGAGFLEIYERGAGGAFARTLSFSTAVGARGGLVTSDGKRLYLAVPHRGQQPAEIREYDLAPGGAAVQGGARSG
jgi:DNA-binding beta-propeller fold protein YncE